MEIEPSWRPRREWIIPSGTVLPKRISPSGMERLFGCELAYYLRHVASLGEAGDTVPDNVQLHGTLAHAVFAEVFPRGPALGPDDAKKRARQALARLSAPGVVAAGEREDAENKILRAVGKYSGFLTQNRFDVLGAEEKYECALSGILLGGRADQVLGRHGTPLMVVDFKWGGLAEKQRKLTDGTALQLALYAFLARKTEWPAVGYFVITRAEMLTTQMGLMFAKYVVGAEGPEETFTAALPYLEARWKAIESGRITADGVGGTGEKMKWEPPCDGCAYDALCGRRWGDR